MGANGFDGDQEAVGCMPRFLKSLAKHLRKTQKPTTNWHSLLN